MERNSLLQGGALVLVGWTGALTWSAILIAVRASSGQTIGPHHMIPVWSVSLAIIATGTFHTTKCFEDFIFRSMITFVALCLQVLAYGFIYAFIYIWAGGPL